MGREGKGKAWRRKRKGYGREDIAQQCPEFLTRKAGNPKLVSKIKAKFCTF